MRLTLTYCSCALCLEHALYSLLLRIRIMYRACALLSCIAHALFCACMLGLACARCNHLMRIHFVVTGERAPCCHLLLIRRVVTSCICSFLSLAALASCLSLIAHAPRSHFLRFLFFTCCAVFESALNPRRGR